MAIFISEINIKKLRHLENIDITISNNKEKKHLILTGKNGSGKTTVLENIKGYMKSIEYNEYNYINDTCVKDLIHFNRRLNELESSNESNSIEKESVINAIKDRNNIISRYSSGLILKLNNDEMISSKYKKGDFILAYFNAKRDSKVVAPKSVNKVELKESYSIEEDIDTKFLDYLVYLKTQQSFARNEEDMETVKSIGEWFDNFEESLRKLFDDNSIKLKFEYKNLNFKIHQEGREPYGLNELSDGFSAVLDIIMNLILRMEKNRVGITYNKEGVVLIDEVETHLHIGLQKKILPFLISFFPNIQFIVTTHSPFVINSINNVVIYDLEKKLKVEDLSAYSYEGIVEGYFNIDQYSTEAKDKLFRYKDLVYKSHKSEEEEIEVLKLRQYFKGTSENLANEIIYEFKKIELSRLNNK